MSERGPVQGVLIAHGTMAGGLVDATERITGVEGALIPLSNEGRGPQAILAALDEAVGTGTAIIFTDLLTGSCALAARSLCREDADRAIVCGVNLPILLDFVFHRTLPLDDLVTRLVERGRAAVQCVPARPLHADSVIPG